MRGPGRKDLKTMEMPETVRAQALRMVDSMKVAESMQVVRMAASRAEGFVLGLETAGFHEQLTEALYLEFEATAADCAAQLSDAQRGAG